MSAPEKVEGYKCLEGNLHETLQELAECNVQRRIADHIMGDGNDKNRSYCFAAAGVTPKEFARSVPVAIAEVALTQEIKMVQHWITKQPELLETVIRLFMEESGSDVMKGVKS